MKWIKFAWMNLWRNKRRAALTLGITAVGTAAMLVFGGFMLFTFVSLEEMAARESGHVILSHAKYYIEDEPAPMAYGIASWRAIADRLKQDGRVRYALPRINFTGLISNGEKSVIYIASGVDAEQEFLVHGPFLDVKKGNVLTHDPKGVPQVMLGADMAKDLKASIGGVLTMLTTTSKGVLNGIDVQVAGIYATGIPEMDKRALMVDLATAQELLMTDKVSTISAYLRDGDQSIAAGRDFGALYPELGITQWSDLAFFYHKVHALYIRIFGVFGVIIVIVVGLSVSNTMMMTVVERTREIGTMRAMGAFPAQVLMNFILESGIVGFVGALAGMLIAGATTVILSYAKVMMPPPPGSNVGYPLLINFSWKMYIVVGVILTLITMFGGVFAARKGVKKPIVEALAHV